MHYRLNFISVWASYWCFKSAALVHVSSFAPSNLLTLYSYDQSVFLKAIFELHAFNCGLEFPTYSPGTKNRLEVIRKGTKFWGWDLVKCKGGSGDGQYACGFSAFQSSASGTLQGGKKARAPLSFSFSFSFFLGWFPCWFQGTSQALKKRTLSHWFVMVLKLFPLGCVHSVLPCSKSTKRFLLKNLRPHENFMRMWLNLSLRGYS